MEIIAVTSRKGGNAKTTTAQNLAAGLAKKGKRVLLLDLDSQCNLTMVTGADSSALTTADILTGTPAAEAIQRVNDQDIIPASLELTTIESEIQQKPQALAEALKPIKNNYDYIFMDTGADLNPLLINALMVSTGVIIPVQAETFSAQGVAQIYNIIKTVQKRNKDLKIKGILITRYNKRAGIQQEIIKQLEVIAQRIGSKVYNAKIRECNAIKEAQARQQDIFTYKRTSNAAKDYAALIAEL